MRRIAALIFLLAPAAVVSAQRPRNDIPIPRLGETMEVSIVNLDVVVTDQKGERVYGLTRDDFEVREERKVQPITNFAEYRSVHREVDPERARVEAPDVAPALSPSPSRPPRTIVIVIEQQKLLPRFRDDFFAALHKLIDQSLESGDRAMVATWRGSSLSARQAMTSDREAIHAVLDRVGKELWIDPAQMIGKSDDLTSGKTGNVDCAEGDALLCATQQLMEIRAKANAVGGLVSSMAALDGRKILLLAMRRLGAIAGADCFRGGTVPAGCQWQFETNAIRARLIESANASGFTLYPVYAGGHLVEGASAEGGSPPGIRGPDDISGLGAISISLNEAQALAQIADKTGGAMEWGPAVVNLIPRLAEDLQSYYSIAYRATGAVRDRVRKVEVTTKRKDLRVRMRSEIVEKSDVTRMKDRVTAALSYVADAGTLGIRVITGTPVKNSRGRLALPIKVQVPIGQLTLVREGEEERGAFSLFVGAGNGALLFSDITQRMQTLAIPLRDLERARQGHFTYEVELTIDAKVDRIAVGVYDEVGRQYGLMRVDHLAGGD